MVAVSLKLIGHFNMSKLVNHIGKITLANYRQSDFSLLIIELLRFYQGT